MTECFVQLNDAAGAQWGQGVAGMRDAHRGRGEKHPCAQEQ